MARKASIATLNKRDAVRQNLATHGDTPAGQVVAALAEQGVEVSLARVNRLKSADRKTPGRRGGGRRAKAGLDRSPVKTASKAEAIREALKKLDGGARPRDVIAHLKTGGVVVSAAQVSLIRKQFRQSAAQSADGAAAGKHASNRGIAVEHLIAAKRLADQLGLDAARKALDVLARLA
jgi:hypothetical protein